MTVQYRHKPPLPHQTFYIYEYGTRTLNLIFWANRNINPIGGTLYLIPSNGGGYSTVLYCGVL